MRGPKAKAGQLLLLRCTSVWLNIWESVFNNIHPDYTSLHRSIKDVMCLAAGSENVSVPLTAGQQCSITIPVKHEKKVSGVFIYSNKICFALMLSIWDCTAIGTEFPRLIHTRPKAVSRQLIHHAGDIKLMTLKPITRIGADVLCAPVCSNSQLCRIFPVGRKCVPGVTY